MQVSNATLSPPPSVSLVNVTVAFWVPVAPTGGAQRIPTATGATIAAKLQLVWFEQPDPFASNVNQPMVCVIVALAIARVPSGAAPPLVTLMFAVPIAPPPTVPNIASCAMITALVPVPLSDRTRDGIAGSLLPIVRLARRDPDIVGSNVTSTSANEPCGIVNGRAEGGVTA